MARTWIIKKYDGNRLLDEWSATGALSEQEIHKMLQRLVSRNLSDEEVIDASLRNNDPKHARHLERIGRGKPIQYGEGIYYTAELEAK